MQCAAASLNSGDCFFVFNCSDMSTIVWNGRHSSTDEQRSAHKAASSMAATKATVAEGAESEEWWALLGGKGEYFQGVVSEAEQESIRLFHCTNATGKFKVEEVPNFSQQSLLDETDDIMLLDTGHELYIWNGPDSNDAERKAAKELAATYCQETGRPGMAVFSVVGGHEPPAFTSCFVGWNSKASSKVAAAVAQQAAKPAAAGAASPVPAASAAVQGLPTTTKFSLEALQARAADTVGCDPARLHEYAALTSTSAPAPRDAAPTGTCPTLISRRRSAWDLQSSPRCLGGSRLMPRRRIACSEAAQQLVAPPPHVPRYSSKTCSTAALLQCCQGCLLNRTADAASTHIIRENQPGRAVDSTGGGSGREGGGASAASCSVEGWGGGGASGEGESTLGGGAGGCGCKQKKRTGRIENMRSNTKTEKNSKKWPDSSTCGGSATRRQTRANMTRTRGRSELIMVGVLPKRPARCSPAPGKSCRCPTLQTSCGWRAAG